MKNYTLQACEQLIDKYVNDLGGQVITIEEGVLGLGKILLYGAPNKKAVIIKEYYISPWSSGHTVTMYNKLPKKYQDIIDNS